MLNHFPQTSLESTIFRPKWIRKDGILYQANNAYLITGTDGLDPRFSYLKEVLVINGYLVVCLFVYFDDHYHAYVVNITSQNVITHIDELPDFNVYHSHRLFDGLDYISFKYSIV